MAEMRITYNYAVIDETGWCYRVYTTSRNLDGREGYENYIPISVYSEDYMEKYYNVSDGKWYLEDTFTTEWIPE